MMLVHSLLLMPAALTAAALAAAAAAACAHHQDEMASAGYRTLLVAQRELTHAEYEAWEEAYSQAQVRVSRTVVCARIASPCIARACCM